MTDLTRLEIAANLKADAGPNWYPYKFVAVKGGIICTGCETRPKKSGPNKGEIMYTMKNKFDVIVTPDDLAGEA
ncbi:hypothetical protein [Litorivivens sp.]|uniref:hypothetical protein n=1 Tax=Litorivivens sp. TaxID=2020868 RepID=UPI003565154D